MVNVDAQGWRGKEKIPTELFRILEISYSYIKPMDVKVGTHIGARCRLMTSL